MWLAADLAFGICALARPQLALGFLLATLPLFAHRAPSPWRLHFILLISFFELVYLCRLKRPWKGAVGAVRGNPILLLGALYVAASLLSLSSLTPLALIEKHIYLLRILPLSALPNHFATTLNLPERSREYAVVSAFLTLQAFVFCLIVWREMTRDPRAGVRFAVALVVGALVWSAVGVMEFFGGPRLTGLRGIYAADSLVDVVPRLQSVSGNPGWFAQSLVMVLPYAAVLYIGKAARWFRLALTVLAIAVIEFVLVLTFQRGGWVASIIVLCCLAAGSAILAWRRSGRAAPHAMIVVGRSLGVLAVVAALAFSLLYISIRAGVHPGGTTALAAYSERLQVLMWSPVRLQYASAAFKIGKLYPILGGGSESFALRYTQQFFLPTGWYFDTPSKVDPSSAHNVYLQTFAGKGVVGLALLLAMCVSAVWACVRVLLLSDRDDRSRLLLSIIGGTSIVGFLVYGLVQEVFYVHALQVLFFFSLGFVAAVARGVLAWPAILRKTLWTALAVLFVVHLGYEYVYPGPSRLVRPPVAPEGIWWQEPDEHGVIFRWTSSRVIFPVPRDATAFAFRVRTLAPFRQSMTVLVKAIPVGTYTLEDHEWHQLRFLIPASREAGEYRQVEIRVAPTFDSGGRTLGVMLADAQFR